MKKSAAVILALLLAALTLASCGNEVAGGDETKAAASDTAAEQVETETTAYTANIPEGTDYNGYEFKFLHWYFSDWGERANKDLYAESVTGDIINDAVYERNSKVEDMLNIKISAETCDFDKIVARVNKDVASGETAYDAVYVRLYEVPSLLTSGAFLNLLEMPNIDLSQPWWDASSVNELSIDNKLFLVASDINIIDKNATAGIAFNKQLADSYGIEDCYSLVRDGKWTQEKMISLYSNVSSDINGDGKMDPEDLWGFLSKNDALTSFFHGAGGHFVTKDENDLPKFTFGSDRDFSVTSDILDMAFDEQNFFNQIVYGTNKMTDQMYTQMFMEGHGLFFWLRLDDIEFMRSSETDFGVLPTPKYDEAQENYYSTVSIHTTGLLSVPVTTKDAARTGMILEALSAESKNTVQPAYYDVCMTSKFTRDIESGEMLNIIMAHRTYDLGCVFSFGNFANLYQEMPLSKTRDIASLIAKNEQKVNSAIDKVVEKFSELG